MRLLVVELIDENDDLVGYGVCAVAGDGLSYTMRPEVHGTRSQAHATIQSEARA